MIKKKLSRPSPNLTWINWSKKFRVSWVKKSWVLIRGCKWRIKRLSLIALKSKWIRLRKIWSRRWCKDLMKWIKVWGPICYHNLNKGAKRITWYDGLDHRLVYRCESDYSLYFYASAYRNKFKQGLRYLLTKYSF